MVKQASTVLAGRRGIYAGPGYIRIPTAPCPGLAVAKRTLHNLKNFRLLAGLKVGVRNRPKG